MAQGWWRRAGHAAPRIVELVTEGGKLWTDVPIDRPLFDANPPRLEFHDCAVGREYTALLQLRNVDKVSRRVKLETDSAVVTVRRLAAQRSVAPGMAVEYEVTLRHETDGDYSCDLVVTTERERFLLPLRAKAPRLRLELPDVIDCGATPVKAQTTRSYCLLNIGAKAGAFRLDADDDFEVAPTRATLAVDGSVQCAIRFTPRRLGQCDGSLTVRYDTGDCGVVALRGVGLELAVSLPTEPVILPTTYITQSTSRAFVISNLSAASVRFRGGTSGGGFFEVYPLQGVIPPYAEQRCVVEFRPRYARLYKAECRLDVDGSVETRPIRLQGQGVGPDAAFERGNLDAGNVLVHVPHTFRAVLRNRGEIDAAYKVLGHGAPWTCAPSEGSLRPGSAATVEVTTTPGRLGEFKETLFWKLAGSSTTLPLTLRGVARAPGFLLTPRTVDFGDVAVGLPRTHTLALRNTSRVAFAFRLEHDLAGLTLQPQFGSLLSGEVSQIALSFTPQAPAVYGDDVTFCIDGIEKALATVAVTATAKRPVLEWTPRELNLGTRCIDDPHRAAALLANRSDDLEALVQLDDLDDDAAAEIRTTLLSSTLGPKVPIYPRRQRSTVGQASVEVDVEVVPRKLGPCRLALPIMTTGALTSPLEVAFDCVGPRLDLTSDDWRFAAAKMAVAFGVVPVLTVQELHLQVRNASPVATEITAALHDAHSCFQVHPEALRLESGQVARVSVRAEFDAALSFKDTLEFKAAQGDRGVLVDLSAKGEGSCVRVDVPTDLSLGNLYLAAPCEKEFVLDNQGRLAASLKWHCIASDHCPKPSKKPRPEPTQARPPGAPQFLGKRCV